MYIYIHIHTQAYRYIMISVLYDIMILQITRCCSVHVGPDGISSDDDDDYDRHI